MGQGAAVPAFRQAGAQEGIHVPVKRDAVLLLGLCQALEELCTWLKR